MELIIFIRFNPFYSNSASANRFISLIEGLISNKVDITLYFTGGYQSINEINRFGNCGEFRGLKYIYLVNGLYDTIWKRRFDIYLNTYFKSIFLNIKIGKLLKNFKGIIWLENDQTILKIVFSKKNKSAKTFMEINEFFDIHKFNNDNYFQKRRADNRQAFFNKIVLKELSGLALMTKTLFNHFKCNEGVKLNHLPMTVDLNRFCGSKNLIEGFKKPYITFVGVMNDKKDGVSILIEAFNKISLKYPECILYLVGSWNYDTPKHLKLIEAYQLTDKVFWMKEYSRDEIPNIICNADLLVLPRPDSKQAQGGFPTKLGEYLASGVPVCATTVGEIPDYLVDNESVFFAEPGSVESFAAAMDRALSDPENARKIGLNGRKVAEKEFNKDIQAKKLYDFLKTL